MALSLEAIRNLWQVDTSLTPFANLIVFRHSRYMETTMRAQVKKWGNSASVRIPSSVMEAAALHIDQAVDVREEGGRVVIEPIRAVTYDLDDLLAGMKPSQFHDDADFGVPVGKEIW
jgi:antitoxin MazE